MCASDVDDELSRVGMTANDGVEVTGGRWLLGGVRGETEGRDLIEADPAKAAIPLCATLKKEISSKLCLAKGRKTNLAAIDDALMCCVDTRGSQDG